MFFPLAFSFVRPMTPIRLPASNTFDFTRLLQPDSKALVFLPQKSDAYLRNLTSAVAVFQNPRGSGVGYLLFYYVVILKLRNFVPGRLSNGTIFVGSNLHTMIFHTVQSGAAIPHRAKEKPP